MRKKFLLITMALALSLTFSLAGCGEGNSGDDTPIKYDEFEILAEPGTTDYGTEGIVNWYINNSDYTIMHLSVDSVPIDIITVADFAKHVTFESKTAEEIDIKDIEMGQYVKGEVKPGETSERNNMGLFFTYGDSFWDDYADVPNMEVYDFFRPEVMHIHYLADDGLVYMITYYYDSGKYSVEDTGRDPSDY